MNPLRSVILAAAGSDTIRNTVTTAPVARDLAHRFVAGASTDDAVAATASLISSGLSVTLDYLGEDTTDVELAEQTVEAYLTLLERLGAQELGTSAEVSVKLSAVGQKLDSGLAFENASRICAAAAAIGTTVTLDMEDHTTTDATLETLHRLRSTWPSTGAVVQTYLRRTLDDCRALSGTGSRVRLCKGAYNEPDSVAFSEKHDVDRSYVRCANTLLAGDGYPMFATHDPKIIRILAERALWYDRKPGSFEYQMLYGIRPEEQLKLAEEGNTMRVYVPYGVQWYGYLMRRLAERPSNVAFFARALVSKS